MHARSEPGRCLQGSRKLFEGESGSSGKAGAQTLHGLIFATSHELTDFPVAFED
jgi:hypothetical protein